MPTQPDIDLGRLIQMLKDKGCKLILAKELADNDNSKNQVYLGSDFSSLNLFPALNIQAGSVGINQTPIFKAALRLSWLSMDGGVHPAPGAQLILYPQYPEVRFSGFLKQCDLPPSDLMRARLKGRILFLGICENGQIFGYVVGPESPLAHEFQEKDFTTRHGVFTEIPLGQEHDPENLAILLERLRQISLSGWIRSHRLDADGNCGPCESSNCGGYTLEAMLGIRPNGYSEPDYLGWEIKQFTVHPLDNLDAGTITLMTPEPQGGLYKTHGVVQFVRDYGYPDTFGRYDRLNFGGIHRFGEIQPRTHLTLVLYGYESGRIFDSSGYLGLVDSSDRLAAAWDFVDLLKHWNRKHNRAAYIPSGMRKDPALQYQYSHMIRLCRGTDFGLFLKAVSVGRIYYDPGIKVWNNSALKPNSKRRSQFRIRARYLSDLYHETEIYDLNSH